ncbi:MAG: hypothetical protein KDB28_15505, partial [Tetrasphaera sp.]|nr:hypothetical protein [Tetrasphaera sp.]
VLESPGLDAHRVAADLVAVTSDGVFHRISLEDGRHRWIAFGSGSSAGGGEVRAGATIAAINLWDTGRSVLIGPDGLVDVDMSALASSFVAVRPGAEQFVFDSSGVDGNRPQVYDAHGVEVDTASYSWLDGSAVWELSFAPDGAVFVQDSGGGWVYAADGAVEQVTTGAVVSTSGSTVLARECDAERRCGHVLIDVTTGERRAVPLEAAIAAVGGADPRDTFSTYAVPSPDGRSFLTLAERASGVSLWILTFEDDGTVSSVELGEPLYWGSGIAMWLPDSSAIVMAASGHLAIIDRTTGEIADDVDLGATVQVAAVAPSPTE